MNKALEVLNKYWGYPNFRHPQEGIIQSVVDRKDTLAILPTGAGKSICYQVPALMLQGTTLVVSPLIALMNDQVGQLKKRDINAFALHSGISKDAQETLLSQLHSKPYAIVYLSPEKLVSQWFQERIQSLNVKLIAIDEAHCISQWGYDFRPEYLKIKEFTAQIQCPKIALTASATSVVQQDIVEKLGLKSPDVYVTSTFRENLSYKVIESDEKEGNLIRLLPKLKGSSIVYLRTRKLCQEIGLLCEKLELPHAIYHAGLTREQRNKAQSSWIKGEVNIMLATNAFGMGIDKPDVRTVIHYMAPSTLEAYYQEAGRAGRDGKPSEVFILNGAKDKYNAYTTLNRSFPQAEMVRTVFQAMCDMLQIAEGIFLDEYRVLNIDGIKKRTHLEFMDIHYCLKLMDLSGILKYEPDFNTPSKLMVIVSPDRLYHLYENNPSFESIVKSLIRLYGAPIYDQEIRINEHSIAQMSEMHVSKIQDVLTFLHQNDIVKYFKGTDQPVIQFLMARPAVKSLPLNHALIRFLKERAIHQLDSMYDYISSTECKQVYLAKYFGSEHPELCGKCSACLLPEESFDLDLLLVLKEKGNMDMESIKDYFSGISLTHLSQSIEHLLLTRRIKKGGDDRFEVV